MGEPPHKFALEKWSKDELLVLYLINNINKIARTDVIPNHSCAFLHASTIEAFFISKKPSDRYMPALISWKGSVCMLLSLLKNENQSSLSLETGMRSGRKKPEAKLLRNSRSTLTPFLRTKRERSL